jgi:WD40 repeat protein
MRSLHAQQLATMRLDGPMSSAAVSPDGRYVAVNIGSSAQKADGSWNSTESIQVLELAASKVIAKVDLPSASLLKDGPLSSTDGFVGYCDNGKYLAVYDEIGTIYVLNARSFEIESKISLGEMPHVGVLGVRRVVCSAGSSLIAVNSYGGQFGWGVLRLFDLTSGGQIAELRQNPSAGTAFRQISLSPDGSKLAILLQNPRRTPTKSPNVEIRETKDLALISQLTTGDVPDGLTFSGDLEVVTVQGHAMGRDSSRRALQLWNVESGKEARRYTDASSDVQWPISSSADGTRILGYIPTFRECRFCNGLEGRRDVKEQRFAVWNKITGAEIYRSEPFSPIVEPLGPQPVLSQDGTTAMVYWPDNVITPRTFPLP